MYQGSWCEKCFGYKVQREQKKALSDYLRSIFYVLTKEKALEFYDRFQKGWQTECPSAGKCLENSIDSCLTFFSFPQGEGISLRRTTIIER